MLQVRWNVSVKSGDKRKALAAAYNPVECKRTREFANVATEVKHMMSAPSFAQQPSCGAAQGSLAGSTDFGEVENPFSAETLASMLDATPGELSNLMDNIVGQNSYNLLDDDAHAFFRSVHDDAEGARAGRRVPRS